MDLNKFYILKHEKFLDVAVYVTKHLLTEESLIIDGFWVNLGFVSSFVICKLPEPIIINLKDKNQWLYHISPSDECYRQKDGPVMWDSLSNVL